MSKLYTRTQVEEIIAGLMAQEKHPSFSCVNLKVLSRPVKQDDGSKVVVTTVTAAKDVAEYNRSSDGIRLYSVAKVRIGEVIKPVKHFTFSELHLMVNAYGKIGKEAVQPAAWMFNATFVYDTVNCHWYAYSRREGKDFFYQLDGALVEISLEEWTKHVKHGLIYNDCSAITGSYASAGNMKRHKLVCSCMSENGLNALARSIRATGGISMLYTNPERLATPKAVAQAGVRESAPYTASFAGPRVRAVAFYMGKWKLRDVVTGELFEGSDGHAIVNGELYRRWMEELGHQVMTEEATTGITIQFRPFSIKGVSTSMPSWGMEDMILNPDCVCHAAEVEFIRASEATRDQQKAFEAAFESKGTKGDYAGKTVVVVYDDDIKFDKEHPENFDFKQVDILADLDAEKAEQDLRKSSCLEILKLFRKKESAWRNGMGTSTQILQSFIPICPSLKAIMRIGFRAQMAMSVEDIVREEARSVTSQDVLSSIKQARPVEADEAAEMSLTDAEKSVLANNDYGMNVVQLAELLAPSYCREKDAALFKDELKAACKAGKSRADKVRVPMDGTDFVLVPDFGAFYGQGIFGLTGDGKYKCYGNLLNKLGVEEVAGVKYPKQHIREVARLAVQSEEETAMALAGHKYAAKVAYLYACLSEAALIIPCAASFMNQEAGLDCDGDELFAMLVLNAKQRDARLAAIDWSKGAQAMAEYVKIQLAYYAGLLLSLVVDIDPDAEDKLANKASKKLKEASNSIASEAPNPTVNHDEYWKGVKLGENMPTRQEVAGWKPINPGNEASIRNILNANLDVGVVTVIHLIFSDLYFKLKNMEGKADEELPAKEPMTLKVAKAIMVSVFKNKEVPGQKYDALTYEKGWNGLDTVKLDINEYHRIIASARTMELNRVNMMSFFYDLVANGRMAQEFTIDACKTLMKVANIEYAELLRKYVKLLSRQKDMDVDFAYGDKDSHVEIVEPKLGNETKVVTKQVLNEHAQLIDEVEQIVVRDWAYDLKYEGYKAITAAIRPLLNIKPAFDADLIESLVNMATSYPEAAKLADFFKVVYMHLNSAQEQAMRKAIEGIRDEHEVALAKGEVKTDHAGFFNGIGSTLRRGLKNFAHSLRLRGLSADEVAALEAALLISLAYKQKTGNVDSKLSSFAYRVLPEEYMRFILDYVCAEDDRVARYTEDALKWAKPEVVGSTVSFVDGEGYLYGDKVAEAKDALNGEYTIFEEDGKYIASTDVLNLMPLQKGSNTVVVETKLNEWMSSHMDAVLRELAPDNKGKARYVQLWAKKTQGQDGDELHDVIAVEDDGEAYGVGYFHVNNQDETFNLYNGLRGQVTNVTVYEKPTGEKVALLLLENCEHADESQYVDPVFEELPVDEGWVAAAAPVVKAKKFASLKAEAPAAVAEEVVEPVAPAKFEATKVDDKSKFATVELEDPDMDMFDDWDYGEE